jgi:hypothetical protein
MGRRLAVVARRCQSAGVPCIAAVGTRSAADTDEDVRGVWHCRSARTHPVEPRGGDHPCLDAPGAEVIGARITLTQAEP